MLLLSLTTATSACGVALLAGDALLFEAHLHVDRSHARRLAPLVAQAFEHAGRAPAELDAVAVAAGPGSFTGLRIGASTAKGLCLATGAALVAVPSHHALAEPARDGDLVVLPSRRGEVLASNGGPMQPVRLADLEAFAAGCARIVGPNAEAVRDALAEPREVAVRDLRAGAVARLGAARLARGETEDVAAFEPDYGQAYVPSQPAPIFGGPPR